MKYSYNNMVKGYRIPICVSSYNIPKNLTSFYNYKKIN